jgi:transcriptional regulator with XRE-family HTH domain
MQQLHIGKGGFMYSKYVKIRDKAGYTDRKVADEAKIPPSTIYDWKQRSEKRKDAGISAAYLAKIAKVLKCDISELI